MEAIIEGMHLSRRQILRASASAAALMALGGCGGGLRGAGLPGVPWPDVAPHPKEDGPSRTAAGPFDGRPGEVIGRSRWTRSGPITGRVNRMGGVSRITMHHEGATNAPVYFTDVASTAERLERVRRAHLDRGWGDIGYHYVIDRSGAVWEGRPLAYQGAHVRNNNEHNLGILVLGNFDKQRPSEAQLEGLIKTLRACQSEHRVGTSRVFTHQEIVSTACPGQNLQNKMGGVRRYLA
jgi:hypothetical protein